MALEKNLFPNHPPRRLSYLSLFSLSQFLSVSMENIFVPSSLPPKWILIVKPKWDWAFCVFSG